MHAMAEDFDPDNDDEREDENEVDDNDDPYLSTAHSVRNLYAKQTEDDDHNPMEIEGDGMSIKWKAFSLLRK